MAETLTVGLIGLGRMGLGIAGRLIQGGHSVVAYDRDGNARCAAATAAARTVDRVADLAPSLPAPRVVWLMIPAGPAVDGVPVTESGRTGVAWQGVQPTLCLGPLLPGRRRCGPRSPDPDSGSGRAPPVSAR